MLGLLVLIWRKIVDYYTFPMLPGRALTEILTTAEHIKALPDDDEENAIFFLDPDTFEDDKDLLRETAESLNGDRPEEVCNLPSIVISLLEERETLIHAKFVRAGQKRLLMQDGSTSGEGEWTRRLCGEPNGGNVYMRGWHTDSQTERYMEQTFSFTFASGDYTVRYTLMATEPNDLLKFMRTKAMMKYLTRAGHFIHLVAEHRAPDVILENEKKLIERRREDCVRMFHVPPPTPWEKDLATFHENAAAYLTCFGFAKKEVVNILEGDIPKSLCRHAHWATTGGRGKEGLFCTTNVYETTLRPPLAPPLAGAVLKQFAWKTESLAGAFERLLQNDLSRLDAFITECMRNDD